MPKHLFTFKPYGGDIIKHGVVRVGLFLCTECVLFLPSSMGGTYLCHIVRKRFLICFIQIRFIMKRNHLLPSQADTSALSALLMIAAGIGLSIASFVRDPLGEISDSVLWFVAQSLVYAGSIFGVAVYIDNKLAHLSHLASRRLQ